MLQWLIFPKFKKMASTEEKLSPASYSKSLRKCFGVTHIVEAIICGQVSAAMRYLLTTWNVGYENEESSRMI